MFKRKTIPGIIEADLNDTRLALLAAEAALERADSECAMQRSRVTRLEAALKAAKEREALPVPTSPPAPPRPRV